MSETLIVHRTDIPCENCKKYDKRPHSVGNHRSFPYSGCVEKTPDGKKCSCTWQYDQKEGTVAPEEKKKFTLGDLV